MRRLFVLIVALLLLAACGGGDDSPSDENPPSENATATSATTTTSTPDNATPSPALVAEVNGMPITQSELDREIAFQSAGVAPAANQEALVGTVLEDLIEQKIIEQAAVSMGIAVTDAQIQEKITELENDAVSQGYSLDDFFTQQGITAAEYPARLRTMLLTQAVNEQVTANVPNTTIEVHARHILVGDEATARSILDQLNAGADFAALALQYSLDPSTREFGGDLSWIAPGDLVQPEVEAAIFALPANTRNPDPIRSVLGYHIIEAIERREGQPLDATRLAEQRSQAWTEWLNQQRAAAAIVRFVGPNAQQ